MYISVLLSTYNGSKYVLEQLESLKEQSTPPDEVIIIDDCSKDDTVQICRNFIEKSNVNDKWKLYVNEENKGWKNNYHYGLKYTKGDYIFFCDQDDIWKKNKIEDCVNILEKNKNINVLSSLEKDFSEEGIIKDKRKYSGKIEMVKILPNGRNLKIRTAGCTMVVRKTFVDETFDYFVESWAHDDMMWKLSALRGTCALYHMDTIMHRIHMNNASRQSRRTIERRITDIEDTIRNYYQVKKYIKEKCSDLKKIDKLYSQNIKGMELRKKFLVTGDFFCLIVTLIKYPFVFASVKQLLGDIFLVIKRR